MWHFKLDLIFPQMLHTIQFCAKPNSSPQLSRNQLECKTNRAAMNPEADL